MKRLPPEAEASELRNTYHELLQSTYDAWTRYASQHKMDLKDFSYNIGMTTSAIVLCPRTNEGVPLHDNEGSELGFVALNGSFLSGGVLVKRKEEWEQLRKSQLALDSVLAGIGVPLKADFESNI
jgi:sulfate adenylyltransferase (ADP) / ATP adenylyltransferase